MKYKYWLFYLKKDNENDHELYAYTDNKNFALNFKESRNMDKFICVKKKLSQKEVNFLARDYQSNILQSISLKTSDENNKVIETTVIGTMIEKITVTNETTRFMVCGLYEHCWIDPNLFNSEVYKALEILEYVDIYNMMNLTNHQSITQGYIPNIIPDELAIFIHYFGKSMK